MKVTLIFEDQFPLESDDKVTPAELGHVAYCFADMCSLMRIEVDAGGDVLKVSPPLKIGSLDGWLETHPRIVEAYAAAFLEKEAELLIRYECVKTVDIRHVILAERMHFLGVG